MGLQRGAERAVVLYLDAFRFSIVLSASSSETAGSVAQMWQNADSDLANVCMAPDVQVWQPLMENSFTGLDQYTEQLEDHYAKARLLTARMHVQLQTCCIPRSAAVSLRVLSGVAAGRPVQPRRGVGRQPRLYLLDQLRQGQTHWGKGKLPP